VHGGPLAAHHHLLRMRFHPHADHASTHGVREMPITRPVP
jgi:hypothetical protein